MKSYLTLSEAIEACFKEALCNVIFDVDCDQNLYWTYTGGLIDDVENNVEKWLAEGGILKNRTHCSWKKGK